MKKIASLMVLIGALAISANAATKTNSKTRVYNDTTRLAAILSDVQNSSNFDSKAWKTTVNEANTLANRIYANTGGRSQAKELRSHVRMMREAALKDDAAGARDHAKQALPFAYQLVDWAQ
jgi:hypothetical protein